MLCERESVKAGRNVMVGFNVPLPVHPADTAITATGAKSTWNRARIDPLRFESWDFNVESPGCNSHLGRSRIEAGRDTRQRRYASRALC
jgi:hypothetical protein